MHSVKATHTPQSEDRKLAQTSLLDTLGAVQQALSAMPDNVVRMPANLTEAFLLVDPTLSMLNRQRLDGRRNYAKLIDSFGLNDPMVQALSLQLAAIDMAYDERLAALRRKREEGRQQNKITFKKAKPAERNPNKTEEELQAVVRREQELKRRRDNGTLWLWAVLSWRASAAFAKVHGPRAA